MWLPKIEGGKHPNVVGNFLTKILESFPWWKKLPNFPLNQALTVPYTNANSPRLMSIGPPMWQAEADTELTMSASSATAHELREGMKLTSKRNFSGERKTKD